MINRIQNRLRRGMTLIEQVFVAALILVGALVAYFSISGVDDNGQQAACEAERASIVTAQEVHRAQEGAYADTIGDLKSAGFLTQTTLNHETDDSGDVRGIADCA